jgi:hypothetical protein
MLGNEDRKINDSDGMTELNGRGSSDYRKMHNTAHYNEKEEQVDEGNLGI